MPTCSIARTFGRSRSKSESPALNVCEGRGWVKIDLNPDWTEFLSALIGHRVRFVLVGGHAVAGHAEPRFTEDLDVFVEPSFANGKRLRAALVALGFGAAAPPASVLAAPDKVFMLGRKPKSNAWRVPRTDAWLVPQWMRRLVCVSGRPERSESACRRRRPHLRARGAHS
jgi:hypothetical protein